MLMSEANTKELGLTPLVYIAAGSSAGLAPEIMGLGPVYATKQVLAKSRMDIKI